jgi:hypothetical protein
MSQVVILSVSDVEVVGLNSREDVITSHERDVSHICPTSSWSVGPPGEDRGNLHSIVQPAERQGPQGTKAPGIVGIDSESESNITFWGLQ